ncbi:hypothetical protein RhiirC2_843971 [Rhizophagus irregularis]|uniref:Uncharacterized protein n=1 Tax=Rhizophagus irregularis TaxID=588596 RepID=A0A2N1NVG9_9GLOM|nr:hypothetical protein RhiirC2_843971 [Rhizophagus irregularis]
MVHGCVWFGSVGWSVLSLHLPLGLSSFCQDFLFIRSSLRSLVFTSSFRRQGFLFNRFSLRSLSFCLPLGLSSLCQDLLFIRPSLRSLSLRLPLGTVCELRVWVRSVGLCRMFMQKGDSGCVWWGNHSINAVLESLGVKPYFGSQE